MRVTDEMVEAAETPMSDHIASFWRLLEKEHVRILVEMRRETSSMTYWDSSSFSDDVAKALVADRRAALAVEGTEAEPVAWIWPDAFERLRRGDSPRETVHADTYMRGAIPLYTTPPAGIRDTDEQRAIGNGMAIAAGIVMKCWGDTVTAGEILGAAGYRTIDDLKKDGVDQYDIDLVKPALRGQS